MKMKKFIATAAALVMAMTTLPTAVSADWAEDDGETVYLNEEGKRVRGFEKIDGKTYYFDKKGHLKTGWLRLKNGKTYYMGSDGVMTKGWQTIGKKKYYFKNDGSMKTGWHDAKGGIKYFLNSDGTLAKNTSLIIDGVTYDFDANGKAVKRTFTYTPDGSIKMPVFGSTKNEAVKTLEFVDDYTEINDRSGNSVSGSVKCRGVSDPVRITLSFNSKGQLYGYKYDRYDNCEKSAFQKNILPKFTKSLGNDYTFADNTSGELYNWTTDSNFYVLQRFCGGSSDWWCFSAVCADYSET